MIDSLTDDYGIDDKRIANAIALVDSMNHGVKEAAIEDIFTERESALVNLGQLLDEIALARGEETKVAVAEEND
jgi:hypothetical protein